MKADAFTLTKTLADNEVDYYTIPIYQRPYTWNTETVMILWDDLAEAFADYQNAMTDDVKPEYYFLGPVVFVKNEKLRSYDIIDGQQRITTFHILLWYLLRKLKNEEERGRISLILKFLDKTAKLIVSDKDSSTFLKIQESDEFLTDTSNMGKVANYLNKQVSTLTEPDGFAKFLRDFTQFIVIIADDYNRAWDLFIGLNGKGEPLNPTDLIKAHVCGTKNNDKQIGDIWEQKILPLKENSTNFLLFLTRYKAKKYLSENSLFKEFTEIFDKKIKEFDLIKLSEVFYSFWMQPIDDALVPFKLEQAIEIKKNLVLLRDLGRRDITTILYQVAEEFGHEKIFDLSLLKILSAYQMRMAMSGKRLREKQVVTRFKEIVFNPINVTTDPESRNGIVEQNWKNCLDLIRKFCVAELPNDTEFKQYVEKSKYGNATLKYLLRSYEQGEHGNKIIQDFQIEHLMPQTPTDYWFKLAKTKDKDIYSNISNSIGNLFIIDKTTNVKVRNKDFNDKKEFCSQNLKDWSISRVTKEKNKWTKREIDERASEIADWAVKYWAI